MIMLLKMYIAKNQTGHNNNTSYNKKSCNLSNLPFFIIMFKNDLVYNANE